MVTNNVVPKYVGYYSWWDIEDEIYKTLSIRAIKDNLLEFNKKYFLVKKI